MALNKLLENSGLSVRIAPSGTLFVVAHAVAVKEPFQPEPAAVVEPSQPVEEESPTQEVVITGTRVVRGRL